MAKLDITAAQIQSTTNMLPYNAPAADWASDTKYPSAKAVVTKITEMTSGASGNTEFPVGSIIIMGLDPNNQYIPNDPNGKISGSWTLVDKAFKTAADEMGKDPSTPYSQAATGLSVTKEVVIRNDHSLLLQLVLQVSSSKAITVTPGQDPTHLATLSINNYGLSSNELPFPITNVTAFSASPSTTASSIIRCSLNADRKLVLNDVVTGGVAERKLEAGSSIYINMTIPVPYTAMKNDFCDKFYWKRTAPQSSTSTPTTSYVRGDFNNDGTLSVDDANYLQSYLETPDEYPIYQSGDMDGDGDVDSDDVSHLGFATFYPDRYLLASEGLEFTTNGDDTCYLSGLGTCPDTNIIIPSKSLAGDVITSISTEAFKDCTNLITITIPNVITSIGENAFENCASLTTINCEFAEGIVEGAPWGATNATIIYKND